MIKRLIEYLVIERRTEYIQYESSSRSNSARNCTSYSALKTISVRISTIINISQRKFILFNYSNFFIFINVFNVDKRVKRIIKNKQIISLSLMLIINVSIQMRNNSFLSKKRDYMFYSKVFFNFDVENDVFIYIIDVNMSIIQIRNVTSKIVIIFRYVKLKRIMNYEKKIVI